MLERFTWFRQSAFRYADEERTIYIDPWGTEADAPRADLILITHAHFDHLQPDEIARLSAGGAKIVAPHDVAAELSGDVIAVAPGGSHEVAGVRFTTVPAYNNVEERLEMHPKANRWVGYVLELQVPFTSREEISLLQRGPEVVVQAGRHRRHVFLPSILAGKAVTQAKLEGSILQLRFQASEPTACSTCSKLARWPVARLSSVTTLCPSRSSDSTRCEPMNPAPPVTSQRYLDRASMSAAHDGVFKRASLQPPNFDAPLLQGCNV